MSAKFGQAIFFWAWCVGRAHLDVGKEFAGCKFLKAGWAIRLGGQTEFRKWCVYFEPNCVLFGEVWWVGVGGILKAWAWVLVQDFCGHDGQSWIVQAGLWFEMLGIPARGFCEASVRVMSCRAGTICGCL